VDLFATLLDVGGADLPPDRWGRSLLPLLLGRGEFQDERVIGEVDQLRTPPGGRFPFLEKASGFFLRTRNWRYVRVPKRGFEGLYRITDNVVQSENGCSAYPEICGEMRAELGVWQAAMRARPPIGRSSL
jgi:hypothetical protein